MNNIDYDFDDFEEVKKGKNRSGKSMGLFLPVTLVGLVIIAGLITSVFLYRNMQKTSQPAEVENAAEEDYEVQGNAMKELEFSGLEEMRKTMIRALNERDEECLVGCAGFLAENDPEYERNLRETMRSLDGTGIEYNEDSFEYTYKNVEHLENCDIYTLAGTIEMGRAGIDYDEIQNVSFGACYKNRQYTLLYLSLH